MNTNTPAGRELDALIAEKLLGFEVCRNEKGGWSLGRPDYWDDRGSSELLNPLPSYSDDGAAVWDVVAWATNQRLEMKIGRAPGRSESSWSCWFERDGTHFYAEGETAPHAICLAALKAIE